MKERQIFLEKSWNTRRKKNDFKLIPDLILYLTHLHSILAPKKVVERNANKNKFLYHMYDDFHAHVVPNNLKTQESNMQVKKELLAIENRSRERAYVKGKPFSKNC